MANSDYEHGETVGRAHFCDTSYPGFCLARTKDRCLSGYATPLMVACGRVITPGYRSCRLCNIGATLKTKFNFYDPANKDKYKDAARDVVVRRNPIPDKPEAIEAIVIGLSLLN